MKTARMTIWVMVIICNISLSATQGATYDFGGEWDIDFDIVNDSLRIFDNPSLGPTVVNLVEGGSVDYSVIVYDNSQFNMLGGSINGLQAQDNSIVYISGGVISRDNLAFSVGGNSVVYIFDGVIGGEGSSLGAGAQGMLYISGGLISAQTELYVYGSGQLIIEGTGFNYPYGSITNSTDILTGTLINGDLINNRFYVHDDATIILIPESTTVLTIKTEPNFIAAVNPSVGQHTIDGSSTISVSANSFIDCPNVWQFQYWEGNVLDPNSANTQIVMDANEIITAVYANNPTCGDECHPIIEGDFNHDCIIDFSDFAVFASRWMLCTKPECDYVDSFVGWWQLDETTGTQASDLSNYENNGTLVNGPVWTGDGALSFDGIDDYVEIPHSTSLDINNDITVSVWVYLNGYGTDWPKVVIKPHTKIDDPWEMFTVDLSHYGTYPRFIVTDGIAGGQSAEASDNTVTLNLNQWYHIASTYDGSTIALYLDGQLIASDAASIPIGQNTMPVCIGGRLGTNNYNGLIDEVRIYNRALDETEIQSLYQNH